MANRIQDEPNYKEMYLKLFRASENAINLLVSAQQECEEMYLSTAEEEKPKEK